MEICVVNFSSYAQVLLWLKMNAISIFLEEKKKKLSNHKWLEKSLAKSCKFIGQKVWEPWNPNDKPTEQNSYGSKSFKSKLLTASSCHYVTEMDLFCMRMVWTPKSHAMHHMQGLEIEKRKESPESLFSINVADKKNK